MYLIKNSKELQFATLYYCVTEKKKESLGDKNGNLSTFKFQRRLSNLTFMKNKIQVFMMMIRFHSIFKILTVMNFSKSTEKKEVAKR